MREVRESEMRQAREEDRDPMDVVMVFPESNAYTRGGVHQLPPPAAAGEIAVIFVEDPEQRFLRHGYISVSCHRRKFKTIPLDSIHLDPMCYPLLFLYGERGWQKGAIMHGTHKVTLMEYARYIIAHRDRFDIVTRARKLYQQYLVDVWVRIEEERLRYLQWAQSSNRVGRTRWTSIWPRLQTPI